MMIHLDTNLLVDLATLGSPHIAVVRGWVMSGRKLTCSAIAWSEFCNGPHTKQQKDAVFAVLEKRVVDFSVEMAEQASKLFHYTGRKRGSHADCMIAAVAMVKGQEVATRNIRDFERFVPYGLKLLPVETLAQ